MKITKFGHCCLLIEEQGVRILTDPGMYTTKQNELKNIDILLITHEHGDHYHIDSVKEIVKNNPNIEIITNTAVGKLLDKEGIKYQIIEHEGGMTIKNISIGGFGNEHIEIYDPIIPRVQNTGYMIAEKFFYPGDVFFNPQIPVDVLALPVAGPWCKVKDTIEYALSIKPRIVFPVHDAVLKNPGMSHRVPGLALEKNNIKFVVFDLEKEYEL